MSRAGIATRNGAPAYLNAPVRKTQTMCDLERRMRTHVAEARQLAYDARQINEPGTTRKSLALLLIAICACLGLFGALYIGGPA